MSASEQAKIVAASIKTLDEQRELFLWKYRDVDRQEVNALLKDFKRHDIGNKGELDYHETMMMLERRGEVKTAKELMDMVGDMDKDNHHRITFVEWCCAVYKKSYDDLFTFVDEAAKERAMAEAMRAGEEAKEAEAAIERAEKQKELQAQLRAAALERESKLTGVAGMKAFFARKVEGAQDVTKTNEQQIKEEAARRKALRDAKMKMSESLRSLDRNKSAEEIAREVAEEVERQAQAEAAAKKKAEEDEKAARAARKAAMNSKWVVNGNSGSREF